MRTTASDHCTNLGGHCIIVDHVEHIHQQPRVGVPAGNIAQASHQPVADARGSLSIWPQEQEFLEKGVCENGHELAGQLNLFEVLDEGFSVVNFFQGDGTLQVG